MSDSNEMTGREVTGGGESPLAADQRIRWWPAVVVVLLTAVVVITLFTIPFDDLIQGWHRVVWSGAAILAAIVALTIWLFRSSGISRSSCWRLIQAFGLAVIVLAALFRVSYGGNMEPGLRFRDWVLVLLPVPVDNALVEASGVEKTARELAARGHREDDVYEFLGPGRKPIFDVQLDPDWVTNPPEELWRRKVGKGFSGFVVAGHLVITQEQRLTGEDVGEAILCFDLETGKTLWRHADDAYFESGLGGDGPRATPTIDGELVYVMGATGILNCLRLYTGEVVWSRNVMQDNKAKWPMWGMSGSPLIVDDTVVVIGGDKAAGGDGHAQLLAYDKQTGEPAWRGLGQDNGGYGSPELATVSGVQQIMLFTATKIVGHDAATGKPLWEYPWPGSMPNVAQVVALDGERVFAAKGYAMGSVVLKLVPDGSGGLETEEVWRQKNLMKTKFTNAVIVGDDAYGLSDGKLECINITEGRRQWKVRGGYDHGQVIRVGDHLLIQAEGGDVALVNVNPEKHEEVARFSPLSDRTWNYPLIVGDRLLVRNDLEMACYRLKLAE